MELTISIKGHKYTVQDKGKRRLLYSIKKKGFGNGRYVLLDASNYNLYSLIQTGEDRKPAFSINHNDIPIISITCKSLFLDPTVNADGRDTVGNSIRYSFVSKDHKDFEILRDGINVGSLKTLLTVSGELQYEMSIDDKVFDDYIPLFVLAIDLTFGDMNKSK